MLLVGIIDVGGLGEERGCRREGNRNRDGD